MKEDFKIKGRKKMLKKLVAVFLCVALCLCCFNISYFNVSAASYSIDKLMTLCESFPNGKYWNHIGSAVNNPEGYTSVPCTHHKNGCSYARPAACECNFYNNAIQCMGYAYMIAEKIVGSNPRSWQKSTTLDVSALRVGDVIRYYNDTHSITVVGVDGDKIAYTGANWGGDCLIKWATMDKKELTGFSYVLHAKSNKYTNKNLTFYKNAAEVPKDKINSGEVWQMNEDGSLNVRESYTTSAKKVGTISPMGTFFVYDKYDDGTYLWGRVDDGITKGWAVLNYSKYLSGVTEILTVEKTDTVTQNKEFTVKWNSIAGAEGYSVSIYKADGTQVKNLKAETNEIKTSLPESGVYLSVVSCSNSKASSWKMQSQRTEITVLPAPLYEIQSIALEGEKSLNVGEFLKLKPQVIPQVSKDAVAWKSSNSSVATVLYDGTVLGHKAGTAYIYCSSLTNSEVKAVCKVTVRLSAPTGFTFDENKTDDNSVYLKWNEVQGADGYRLYLVKSNGKYKLLSDTKNGFFTHTSLKAGETYCYNVRAYNVVNGKKIYSDFSGEIFSKTAAQKVENLVVSNITAKSFRLSWDKTEKCDYYALYKYDEKTKAYKRVNTFKKNTVKIKKDSGYTARYKISAVTRLGSKKIYSELSNSVYGITSPKTPVLNGKVKNKNAVLSWSSVEGATSYIIYMKTENGYVKKAVVKASKNKYTVKKLKQNNEYSFKIKACISKGGTKAYSDYSSAVSLKIK